MRYRFSILLVGWNVRSLSTMYKAEKKATYHAFGRQLIHHSTEQHLTKLDLEISEKESYHPYTHVFSNW